MSTRTLSTLCVLLLGVAVAVAACGGSSHKASSNAGEASSAPTQASSSQASSGDACQMLTAVSYDLSNTDTTGAGFDYAADQRFIDSYAGRAPGGIASSVRRLRDLTDDVASAWKDAGVAVNQDPSEDQITTIKGKLHYSSDDQSKNAAAVAQVSTYAATSC